MSIDTTQESAFDGAACPDPVGEVEISITTGARQSLSVLTDARGTFQLADITLVGAETDTISVMKKGYASFRVPIDLADLKLQPGKNFVKIGLPVAVCVAKVNQEAEMPRSRWIGRVGAGVIVVGLAAGSVWFLQTRRKT